MGLRSALLAIAAVPVLGWLLGWVSETADAIGSLLAPAMALAVLAILPIGGRLRPSQGIAAAALILVGMTAMLPEVAAHVGRSPAIVPGERLAVVTQNVLVSNTEPGATADALLAEDADVLMLQEVDGTFAAMLPKLRERYRWGSACTARCSLAIFSRYPLDRVRYRLRDANGTSYGPPLVQTVMRPPGRAPVPLLTVHLPWPIPAGPQKERREALTAAIATIAFPRAIVAGDFNLAVWSHAMRRLDAGLAPLSRVTRLLPSFPARAASMPALPFLPIDQLFAGPDWQVESVKRIGRTGSDHFGIRAVLVAPRAGNAAAAMAWPSNRDRG